MRHPAYGKALLDALSHGFKPSENDYSIDLPHGRIHYPPGRDPEYAPRSSRSSKTMRRDATKPGRPELSDSDR